MLSRRTREVISQFSIGVGAVVTFFAGTYAGWSLFFDAVRR